MSRQPLFHRGMFLGGLVVERQVHLESRGHVCVNMLEEAEELLMPMPRFALRGNRACLDIEGGNSNVVPCRTAPTVCAMPVMTNKRPPFRALVPR